MDELRKAAGQKLLDAAQEFWNACHKEGQYGAVQWLLGTRGELLIYTRGEYLETLMSNIYSLETPRHHLFCGEEIPTDACEHKNQAWNLRFTKGVCKDCHADLPADAEQQEKG